MTDNSKITKNHPPARPMPTLQHQVLQFSSPLPPPEILNAYKNIDPNLLDKLIELTDLQNEHRRELERNNLEAQICHQKKTDSETRHGQWFAFILSLAFIAGSIYLGINGYTLPASILGLGGVTGLATKFINGRKK